MKRPRSLRHLRRRRSLQRLRRSSRRDLLPRIERVLLYLALLLVPALLIPIAALG